MTTKPLSHPEPILEETDAGKIIQFPDAPPQELTAYYAINRPGYPPSLADHFGDRETTIITSEVAAALIPYADTYEGVRYPDLLIAFNANPAANRARKGYLIPEQGKPPDFVMEVASESGKERDEVDKRNNYAQMGVPEYWRFDETGGQYHSVPLAGDRLINGQYQPIPIHETPDGRYWGHSESLNLDLCWENGELRWYDPVAQRYLPDFDDQTTALHVETALREIAEVQRDAAEVQRDAESARADTAEFQRDTETARADNESARADTAEARIRELESQLRQHPPAPPDTP